MCLGDVVGYGASVNECCHLVRERVATTLLGNHDAAVAGRMDYSFYYDAARHALDWTASRIDPAHLEWLRGLPHAHQIENAQFTHGSPVEPEAYEYVFAIEQARELLPHLDALADVNFVGHSHLCKAFALNAAGDVTEVVAPRFGLRRGYKYVVSVGSVGQPRDCDNRACSSCTTPSSASSSSTGSPTTSSRRRRRSSTPISRSTSVRDCSSEFDGDFVPAQRRSRWGHAPVLTPRRSGASRRDSRWRVRPRP